MRSEEPAEPVCNGHCYILLKGESRLGDVVFVCVHKAGGMVKERESSGEVCVCAGGGGSANSSRNLEDREREGWYRAVTIKGKRWSAVENHAVI